MPQERCAGRDGCVKRRAALTVLLAALLSSGATAQDRERTVRLGQIGISFYAVTGQVVEMVLERLGARVELRTGSHSEIFPELGAGSVDLLVAAWLPHAHAGYWREYGADAVELATLYHGAQLFWAVPDYIPVQAVAAVEDLRKPEVAARMQRQIQSTRPDSGLSMGSRRILDAYGLEASGYRLRTGGHADWQAYFERHYQAGDWFVMPYFRPNFLNRIARMRKLDEPRDLLGKENRAVLVARRGFVASAPEPLVSVLRRIELDLDAVAEMDYKVRVDGMTPRLAAHRWMSENAARVDRWFAID